MERRFGLDFVSELQLNLYNLLPQAEEFVEDGGIKMRSALLLHDREALVDRERIFVTAASAQSVKDIGDRGDTAFERDVLAHQTKRISAPIPPFMVRQRNRAGEVD